MLDRNSATERDRTTAPDSMIQRVIAGRYRVERALATGGMGAVYVARQEGLNRLVAVKILRPRVADPDEAEGFQKRFRLEAETLAGLRHPNIVTVHDYGETEGEGAGGEAPVAQDRQYYLAMEYVDGQPMTEMLKGTLPEPEHVVRLVLQVCAALRYAHKRGVIHRDMKLSNVMVERDACGEDRVKVVDFGLAKLMEVDQNLTAAGVVMGSPHFMAPEQVRGLPADHRSDLYAVGVILYCALTGRYPFHGEDRSSTMRAHLEKEPQPFARVAPDRRIPAGLEKVVLRCLMKDPDRRYEDMAALMTDLGSIVGMDQNSVPGLVSQEDTLRGRPVAPSRMVWGWAVGVLIGLLGMVAVGALGLWWVFAGPGVRDGETDGPASSVEARAPASTDRGEDAANGRVEEEAGVAVETPLRGGDPAPAPAPPTAAPSPASVARPSSGRAPSVTPATTPASEAPTQEKKPNGEWKPVEDVRDPWEDP